MHAPGHGPGRNGRPRSGRAATTSAHRHLPRAGRRQSHLRQKPVKLGAILNNLGNVLSLLGRRPEARKAFDESIRVKERLRYRLPRRSGVPPLSQRRLSQPRRHAQRPGPAGRSGGDLPQVIGHAASWPGTRRAWTSATTWRWPSRMGQFLHQHGKSDEAERHLRKALSIWQKPSPTTPTRAASGTTWRAGYRALGDFLGDGNRPGEAESALRQALATFDQFAADFSLVPQYREEFRRGPPPGSAACSLDPKRKWKLKRPFVKPSPCGKNWSPIFPTPRTIARAGRRPGEPRDGVLPLAEAGRVGSGLPSGHGARRKAGRGLPDHLALSPGPGSNLSGSGRALVQVERPRTQLEMFNRAIEQIEAVRGLRTRLTPRPGRCCGTPTEPASVRRPAAGQVEHPAGGERAVVRAQPRHQAAASSTLPNRPIGIFDSMYVDVLRRHLLEDVRLDHRRGDAVDQDAARGQLLADSALVKAITPALAACSGRRSGCPPCRRSRRR